MYIDTAQAATEFANAWQRESSPSRAAWHIRFAADALAGIIASLRPRGHVTTDRQAAYDVLMGRLSPHDPA